MVTVSRWGERGDWDSGAVRTDDRVLTNSRKDSAAAFWVGSSGARTVNVVAYRNPNPTAAMTWKGIEIATCVSSCSSVSSPTPRSIAHHPT